MTKTKWNFSISALGKTLPYTQVKHHLLDVLGAPEASLDSPQYTSALLSLRINREDRRSGPARTAGRVGSNSSRRRSGGAHGGRLAAEDGMAPPVRTRRSARGFRDVTVAAT
jgi:hypothetical protein